MHPLLSSEFDPDAGLIPGVPILERRLSDLRGLFVDAAAYEAALAQGDPVLYTVAAVGPGEGPGALHYAIGKIMPGQIGDEYYLTKGHVHAWRPAAEYYIGLRGEGLMLMEDERTGECWTGSLTPNSALYVPGHATHRTVNTGATPLTYLGIYPAEAGHDYAVVAERNFRQVVVNVDGRPTVMDRAEFLAGQGAADA